MRLNLGDVVHAMALGHHSIKVIGGPSQLRRSNRACSAPRPLLVAGLSDWGCHFPHVYRCFTPHPAGLSACCLFRVVCQPLVIYPNVEGRNGGRAADIFLNEEGESVEEGAEELAEDQVEGSLLARVVWLARFGAPLLCAGVALWSLTTVAHYLFVLNVDVLMVAGDEETEPADGKKALSSSAASAAASAASSAAASAVLSSGGAAASASAAADGAKSAASGKAAKAAASAPQAQASQPTPLLPLCSLKAHLFVVRRRMSRTRRSSIRTPRATTLKRL